MRKKSLDFQRTSELFLKVYAATSAIALVSNNFPSAPKCSPDVGSRTQRCSTRSEEYERQTESLVLPLITNSILLLIRICTRRTNQKRSWMPDPYKKFFDFLKSEQIEYQFIDTDLAEKANAKISLAERLPAQGYATANTLMLL